MLFNSFAFIFLFLPITWLGWRLSLRYWGIRPALAGLVLASLVFYSIWDIRYLAVLLGSISANFYLGGKILQARQQHNAKAASRWLSTGVGFNLAVLIGFKYSYFLASNIYSLFDQTAPFSPLVLPLAISFVTFQKIAYLVDCRRAQVTQHNLLDYLFFVNFFPQLIAGPIVHHKPLIAQTRADTQPLWQSETACWTGIALFSTGLFKKVVLADSLAQYATPVFYAAQSAIPSASQAWQGMLAYTLQLYFDFSGYSDMAIGLALLFGFKLPVNFDSPYQARSVIDFWRRWHISLSSFLRDYLYIPLGGNRHGLFMRYRNVWLTMVIAGIWHGAGWTFLLWGVLHGSLVLCNHAWRDLAKFYPVLNKISLAIPGFIHTGWTFLIVALAWVLFRANDFTSAAHIYQGLWQGLSQISNIGNDLNFKLDWPNLPEHFLAARAPAVWLWLALGLGIVWFSPTTWRQLNYDANPRQTLAKPLSISMLILATLAFWFALKWMATQPATEFLYFNF